MSGYVIPPYRLILAREQRRLQQEQAALEAIERAIESAAKARIERERRP